MFRFSALKQLPKIFLRSKPIRINTRKLKPFFAFRQFNTFIPNGPKIPVDGSSTSVGKIPQQYMISFTCKKCNERSTHLMSKQAYTKGTVLIECPGCHNRHLIADHLKIFSDTRITIEDILKAKGEGIKLGDSNDINFEQLPESIKRKLQAKIE